jgi:tRNA guanosine-2'-O-methyltransferase
MDIQGLLKFLTEENKKQAINEFLKDLSSAPNIQALAQLLETLNWQSQEVAQISDEVSKVTITRLNDNLKIEELEGIVVLLLKLPDAAQRVLKYIQSTIISFLHNRKKLVLPQEAVAIFEDEFDVIDFHDISSETSLSYLLSFLERLYSFQKIEVTHVMDQLVMFLLSIQDESVTIMATRVLRWRNMADEQLQEFAWKMIPFLSTSSVSYHISAGLVLWLRFLISTSKKQMDSEILDEVIQEEEYWRSIQTGLTSTTHEHRKYCLSILKLSIQQLNVSVDNSLITFTQSKRKEQVEDWKRFSTLYEIVGVDTALNQAIAAHGDIVQLLSPESHIKPSWGMALLCTGFKGNMEAVRKYALDLMYSVPDEDLSIFAHEFLTSIFLKYAIEGSHFQVKKNKDSYTCIYGDKLESFIANLIKSLKKNEKALQSTVRNIIDLLANITTFYAPSRMYLVSGLLKGLKGMYILDYDMVKDIYKLFESTAEDEVCETTLQTVHLILLKHIRADVPLLLESLTRFVQYNGYEIYKENIEFFFDYISTFHKHAKIDYEQREEEFQVIYYSLFNEYSTSDEFLKELAKSRFEGNSGLVKSYSKLLGSLIINGTTEYSKAKYLVRLDMFKNSWRSVELRPLYDSLLNDFSIGKLEFFSSVFTEVGEVSDVPFFQFEQLIELNNIISSHKVEFKVKDNMIASLIDVVLAFLKMTPITEEQVSKVLGILQSQLRNGVYQAYKSTCFTLQFLFKNYDVDLIASLEILEAIWDQITAERLILSQRDMHLAFIETLFDQHLLRDSINNEYNAKLLSKMGQEIICLSQTRRCLLPCLSTKLLQYQRAYRDEFEQTLWLIDLMIAMLQQVQDESNMFRIKNVLAIKFNSELSFGGDLYQRVYGAQEISTKINIISILSLATQKFCDEYLSEVISDRYDFVVPKKKTDGTEEIQRVWIIASVLLVSKSVSSELLDSTVRFLLSKLEKEPSPWIRAYMEWIIAIDLITSKRNRGSLFTLFEDQGKPTLVTSAERIAFLVSQKLTGAEAVSYFDMFARRLIPNCASNKPLVRHFSNSLVLSVYPEIQSKKLELAVDGILKCLYEEAKKSEVTGKYRTGDAILWDAEEDFNLTSIFGGVLSRISPRDFEVITEAEFKKYVIHELSKSIGMTKDPKWTGISKEEGSDDKDFLSDSSPLQTKSGAWESILDIDQNIRRVKRSDLIVVSSLVDKPPNLGGICRLCDVLGAGTMTVDDLRVKNHPQFKNVAVTADYWMPMEEVKIENITNYMREKKKEGYTLIGLEQTDKSIVLGKDTIFPSKSLFLLGREAEGIPGELLSELDYCVEIRQVGVIRSMNIQTATAVLVHAYSSGMAV